MAEPTERVVAYLEDDVEDGGALWRAKDALDFDGGHEIRHFGDVPSMLAHIGNVAVGKEPAFDAYLLDMHVDDNKTDADGNVLNGNTVHMAIVDQLNENTIGYTPPVIGMSSQPWSGDRPDLLYADVTKDGVYTDLTDVINNLPDRPAATDTTTVELPGAAQESHTTSVEG